MVLGVQQDLAVLGPLVTVAVARVTEALVAEAAGEGPAARVDNGVLHHVGFRFGHVATLSALLGKGRHDKAGRGAGDLNVVHLPLSNSSFCTVSVTGLTVLKYKPPCIGSKMTQNFNQCCGSKIQSKYIEFGSGSKNYKTISTYFHIKKFLNS